MESELDLQKVAITANFRRGGPLVVRAHMCQTHHVVSAKQAGVRALDLERIAIVYGSSRLPEGVRNLLLAKAPAVLVDAQNIVSLLVRNHELPVGGLLSGRGERAQNEKKRRSSRRKKGV